MSFINFSLSFALFIIIPSLVFIKFRKDYFILAFGFFGIFTMNTSLMAVIRDCGGMEFLQEIGRHKWFSVQYEISYWAMLASHLFLAAFLVRLCFSNKNSNKSVESSP